jgi:hypothetical protein
MIKEGDSIVIVDNSNNSRVVAVKQKYEHLTLTI